MITTSEKIEAAVMAIGGIVFIVAASSYVLELTAGIIF